MCVCVCVCEKIYDYQSLISDSLAEPEPLFFFIYNIDRMPEFEFEAASTTARCATNELGAFESIGSGSRLQL